MSRRITNFGAAADQVLPFNKRGANVWIGQMLPDGKRPSSGHSEGSGVTADDVPVR